MSKMRPRASRAIEPNMGYSIAAGKRIQKIVNAFEIAYKKEALKIAAKYCKNEVQDAKGDDSPVPKALEIALAKLAAKQSMGMGSNAKKVSRWFCNALLRSISAEQRRALRKAGVSTEWLNRKWSVPVTKGQYISKEAAKKIPDYVEWSSSLITKLCERSAQRVQNAIAEGISKGYNLSRLTEKINSLENMDEARAARVALDQSCKLNQFIQVENSKALGVKEGIWVHVPGQYESRASHMKMNGKKFDLEKGMYDPDVEDYVQPGELPYCRCCFKAILPGFLLD